EAEVARFLRDPGASRVGGAAGEVDAAAAELDEEEDVVAAQSDRVNGEEVARQHARRLLAQELAPAWSVASRCRLQSWCQREPPDGAGRDVHAQLEQFAGDSRGAPARVLARHAQDEITDATLNRWPSGSSLWLRPPAARQLPVPAQQRLRRHDQA